MQKNNRKTAVIIVAAGQGTRLGKDVPKALVPLNGKALYLYSFEVFREHPAMGQIVLVVPTDHISAVKQTLAEYAGGPMVTVVEGGAQRWESARNGVYAVDADCQWVMIHDCARPFVSSGVIDSLLKCTLSSKAAFTATPEVDTIREFEAERAGRTIDRSKVVRVGTPQLFHRETLLNSFDAADQMSPAPTDEIMLMQQLGIEVAISWGDPLNFKVTTESDLYIAEAIIQRRRVDTNK